MTTPTGTIRMSDVMAELGISAGTTTSLNDSDVRGLAGKPANESLISMDNLRGKSDYISLLVDFSYGVISNTWSGNNGTTAGLNIGTNRTITVSGSGGTTQTWLESSGTPSDYEVMCQYNYGENLTVGTPDTWQTLSENRFYGVSSGGSTGPNKYGDYTIIIRKRSATSDSISEGVNFRVDRT